MPEVIRCPLCDWTTDGTPPAVSVGMLADVFGYGVMQAVAYNDHLRKLEERLREHFTTHALAEWVRKITELQAELDRLKIDAALTMTDRHG